MSIKYKFSIIVPIYNSELWIENTIQSVINQSIGFNNIQLILVDDGSSDNSLSICNKYKKIYNNIEIIISKHKGVASARNIAIPYISGQYVEFLDSDDFISENTLEEVYNFFEKHKEEISIVSIPMFYFEGRIGEHYLNNKFKKGTRIIDLKENFTEVFVHINSIFIKSNTIKAYRFDENLITCEDAKMVIQLLLDNQKYGVIDKCKYNYRLRKSISNSISQTAKNNIKWYSEQLSNYPLWAYEYCNLKVGYVPNFVKYIIASHLQWRFKENGYKKNVLRGEEYKKYIDLLIKSISELDDFIIDALTQISNEQKKYMKQLKNKGGR